MEQLRHQGPDTVASPSAPVPGDGEGVVSVAELAAAQVHLGNPPGRTHPGMRRYLDGERDGSTLVDLQQTSLQLGSAYRFVRDLVARGGRVLFVGTSEAARGAVEQHAARCGMPCVSHSWPKKKTNRRTVADAYVLLSPNVDQRARQEGARRGLTIVALVDTDVDPVGIHHVIPGNDDVAPSCDLVCRVIADAVGEGRQVAEAAVQAAGTGEAEAAEDLLGQEAPEAEAAEAAEQEALRREAEEAAAALAALRREAEEVLAALRRDAEGAQDDEEARQRQAEEAAAEETLRRETEEALAALRYEAELAEEARRRQAEEAAAEEARRRAAEAEEVAAAEEAAAEEARRREAEEEAEEAIAAEAHWRQTKEAAAEALRREAEEEARAEARRREAEEAIAAEAHWRQTKEAVAEALGRETEAEEAAAEEARRREAEEAAAEEARRREAEEAMSWFERVSTEEPATGPTEEPSGADQAWVEHITDLWSSIDVPDTGSDPRPARAPDEVFPGPPPTAGDPLEAAGDVAVVGEEGTGGAGPASEPAATEDGSGEIATSRQSTPEMGSPDSGVSAAGPSTDQAAAGTTRKARRLAKAAARRRAAEEARSRTKGPGHREDTSDQPPEPHPVLPPTGLPVDVSAPAPQADQDRVDEGAEGTDEVGTARTAPPDVSVEDPDTAGGEVEGDDEWFWRQHSAALDAADQREAEPPGKPGTADAPAAPGPTTAPDAERPRRNLLKGSSEALDHEADREEPEQRGAEPARPPSPGRRKIVVSGAIAIAAAAAVALGLAVLRTPAAVTLATTAAGVESLSIAAGTTDLAGLRQAAARLGRPDAVVVEGASTYLVSMPVTVASSGSLTISDAQLRLRSSADGFVGVEARGGTIRIDGSTVTSWDPSTASADVNVTDGRAYVLARDGAQMDVTGSAVEMLGYDQDGRYGISWRTTGTGGRVDDSRFSNNYHGASMASVEPMEITNSVFERSAVDGLDPRSTSRDLVLTGNIFRDNGRHGVILAVDCTGARLTDNEAYANRGDGIVLSSGSDSAELVGNRSHDNEAAGITVGGSFGVVLRDNDLWSNATGVTVRDGAQQTLIEGNRLSSNRVDGVLISSESSMATLSGNRIDHNGRAGVWVSDGRLVMGPRNTVSKNEAAVRLADESPNAEVFDNVLEDNFKDGVNLGAVAGLRISGNRILDNDAAFSVRTAGDAAPFLAGNTIEGNRLGPERVREPDPVA